MMTMIPGKKAIVLRMETHMDMCNSSTFLCTIVFSHYHPMYDFDIDFINLL
jgi:hypothetical protein